MLKKVVDRAKQIRRSEGFKLSVATPQRLSLLARQRLNRGVFAIEIQENSGFFSEKPKPTASSKAWGKRLA